MTRRIHRWETNMPKQILLTSIIKSLPTTIFILLWGFFVRTIYGQALISDEPSMGWFLGSLGTLYALITAFILVNVWSQFNGFAATIAKEAKILSSLWNYTDYLDDSEVSKKMQKSLFAYLDAVLKEEVEKMGQGERIIHPSKELIEIMKIVDQIKFDDPRDESAFKAVVQAYEELSSARSDRIEQSITRIPPLMKALFILISLMFVAGWLLHMFNTSFLYFTTLAFLAFLVSWSYIIIVDMDNPLKGLWNVSTEVYQNARHHITTYRHTSGQNPIKVLGGKEGN